MMKQHYPSEPTKLIVFDIDGTLLDSSHQLQPRTKTVLQRCQKLHIPFTLATGKNWDAVRDLAEELEIEVPLILSNGAYLRDAKAEYIEKTFIPLPAMRRIIQVSKETNVDLVVYLDEDVFVERMTHNLSFLEGFGSKRMIEIGSWDSVMDRLPDVHKCMVLDRQSSLRLKEMEKKILAELGDVLETCLAMPEILDFMAKGVSKGNALRKVCCRLGISPASVIVFGDGDNDIDILETAGLSVALGNASPLAKARADLIVPSNDCNGPAQLLEYLLDQ